MNTSTTTVTLTLTHGSEVDFDLSKIENYFREVFVASNPQYMLLELETENNNAQISV